MAYGTLSDIFSSARFRTGTSTSDFSDSSTNLISLANKHFREVVTAINQNNEAYYASITLASLSSGIGNYALSTGSSLSGGTNWKVLRVEVTYDGSNWNVATPVSLTDPSTSLARIADINDQFSSAVPYYAVYNNQLYTLPVPTADVASGLRIYEVKQQKELTSANNVFTDTLATNDYQMPKEFMSYIEDALTADIYERIGKIQEALTTRQGAKASLEELRRQFSPRVEDPHVVMVSNAFSDYGE